MADASEKITEEMDFHPCNTPRGMLYYDVQAITTDQQEKLSQLKRNIVREDEIYLAAHPEVKILIP